MPKERGFDPQCLHLLQRLKRCTLWLEGCRLRVAQRTVERELQEWVDIYENLWVYIRLCREGLRNRSFQPLSVARLQRRRNREWSNKGTEKR